MIRIKYKSGWIRFRTIEELSSLTGWSFDRVLFALKTNTNIMGVALAYGEQKAKTRKSQMKKAPEPSPKYQEMKIQLRMVKKRKGRADNIIRKYQETWFTGRVETNEIKHARAESKRLQHEVDMLTKSIEHYKRYEKRKKVPLSLY
ncbi:MAG: hypothetical protein Roseis2KO_27490 [Roseivirga sp.]